MRFISFPKKRNFRDSEQEPEQKQNVSPPDEGTDREEPVPPSFTLAMVRETVPQLRTRSSSFSRIYTGVQRPIRLKSRSFADIRSLTDEYIARKYQFLDAYQGADSGSSASAVGCTPERCLCPQNWSDGASTYVPSVAPSHSAGSGGPLTREAALRRIYVPTVGDPRLKRARATFEHLIALGPTGFSPSASSAVPQAARDREGVVARALVDHTLAYCRVLSTVVESTVSLKSTLDDRLRRRKGGTAQIVTLDTIEEPNRFAEAWKSLENGELPLAFVELGSILPFAFAVLLPCPPALEERFKNNLGRVILAVLLSLLILAAEAFTVIYALQHYSSMKAANGLAFVIAVSLAGLISFISTLPVAVSFWTQVQWAGGDRDTCEVYPWNVVLISKII